MYICIYTYNYVVVCMEIEIHVCMNCNGWVRSSSPTANCYKKYIGGKRFSNTGKQRRTSASMEKPFMCLRLCRYICIYVHTYKVGQQF